MSIDLTTLGSFDPETLRILSRAFDDVWSALEPEAHPGIHAATRDVIATALMQAAMAGERDPERLWCHAMNRARVMSMLYQMGRDVRSAPELSGDHAPSDTKGAATIISPAER